MYRRQPQQFGSAYDATLLPLGAYGNFGILQVSLIRRWFAVVRVRASEIWAWFVLPGVAIVLPWSWSHALFRRVARYASFGIPADRAERVARGFGAASGDPVQWCATHRLVRLVDRADAFVSRFRGNAWLDRHVAISGESLLPQSPFIAVTLHYGAGLWAIRAMARRRQRLAFVSGSLDQVGIPSPVVNAYAQFRTAEVVRAGGAAVIFTGGARRQIVDSLNDGISIVVVADVPYAATRGPMVDIQVLARGFRLPVGVLEIAASTHLPLIFFLMTVEPNGNRLLTFERLPDTVAECAAALGDKLETALLHDPAAWHLWSEAHGMFVEPGAMEDEAAPAVSRLAGLSR